MNIVAQSQNATNPPATSFNSNSQFPAFSPPVKSAPATHDSSRICPSAEPARDTYGNSRHSFSSTEESSEEQAAKRARAHVERMNLQTIARQLISDADPKDGKISRRPLGCLRKRIDKEKPVAVFYAEGTNSAHYGNLQACANVWLCAPCSAKIAERRLQELTAGFERHPELYKCMATYTVQHSWRDSLAVLQRDLEAALTWLRKHGSYRRLLKELGNVGHVRCLEPLHNLKNGWHPHFHDVLLFDHPLTDDEFNRLEETLKRLWIVALNRFGRTGSWPHACDVVRGHEKLSDYLTKQSNWTLAHELTKSQVKKSASHGRTPNQLLSLAGQGDQRAGRLWLEFAVAFRGKHQLQWSRGLKELLGIVSKDDQEIVEEQQEPAALVIELIRTDWRKVLDNDRRAELLNVVVSSHGDKEQVLAFLADLGIKPEPIKAQPVDLPPPKESNDDERYSEAVARIMETSGRPYGHVNLMCDIPMSSSFAEFRNALRIWKQTELIE